MKRHFLMRLLCLAVLIGMPLKSADAGGGSRGGLRHVGTRGHAQGFGAGGFCGGYGWDLAELYRELLNNVPYYALHPPVYYSCPVPRTYGYSPFAYPGYVMTPEIAGEPQPLEIINPHVPSTQQTPASVENDRTAAAATQPEPLVILNPYAMPTRAVAQSGQ
jgi:hypothetical protein